MQILLKTQALSSLEREEPVYRMFTDILSQFIIRNTFSASTASAVAASNAPANEAMKYAHIDEKDEVIDDQGD